MNIRANVVDLIHGDNITDWSSAKAQGASGRRKRQGQLAVLETV